MVRLNPRQRKAMILQAALKIAREDGLMAVTGDAVAKACPVTTSERTVRHYYKFENSLRRACIKNDPELKPEGIELGIVDETN